MIVIALLLALASVAAAEPRAGRPTLEVDAGPAVFDLDETKGGLHGAAALRFGLGRYWSDRFAIGLHFVDHVFEDQAGLESAIALAVAGQFWTSATTFVEAGPGYTFQTRTYAALEPLSFDGWTVTARGGVVVGDNLVLSAELLHTWVRGGERASTTALGVLVGWQWR